MPTSRRFGRWLTKCSRARNYSNLREGNARERSVACLAARSSRGESNPRFLFVREASLAVGPRDVFKLAHFFPIARVGVEPTDISLSN